jgi:hypothetical protein
MFKSYPHFKSFAKTIQDFTKGRKVKLSELSEKISQELCGANVSTLKTMLEKAQPQNTDKNLTEDEFKEAGKRMCDLMYNAMGKVYSDEECLDFVSKVLFNKSYEYGTKSVFIIKYGSEEILVEDSKYIASQRTADDNIKYEWVNYDSKVYNSIKELGEKLAVRNGVELKYIEPPECLSLYNKNNREECCNRIIELAISMGYFKYKKTIFEMLEDSNNKMFLDDVSSKDRIDEDWRELVESDEMENDFDDNGEDAVIWKGGLEVADGIHEFEIKFRELCNAERINENKWIIEGQDSFVVSFY